MKVSWAWVYSRKSGSSSDDSDSDLRSGASASTANTASTSSSRSRLRENLRPWSRATYIDDVIMQLHKQSSDRGVLIRTCGEDCGVTNLTEHASTLEAIDYLETLCLQERQVNSATPARLSSKPEWKRRPCKRSDKDKEEKLWEESDGKVSDQKTADLPSPRVLTLNRVLDEAPRSEFVGFRVCVDGQYGTIAGDMGFVDPHDHFDRVRKDLGGAEGFFIRFDSGKEGYLPRIDASHLPDILQTIPQDAAPQDAPPQKEAPFRIE